MEEASPPKSSTTQVGQSYKLPARSRWGYEEYVFSVSYVIGMSILYLPKEYIDGNPVPTVIFKGQPKTFHSFLLGLIGAFTCAVSTLYIRAPSPKVAGYYRRFAVFFMAASLLTALWAAGPAHWILSSPFVNRSAPQPWVLVYLHFKVLFPLFFSKVLCVSLKFLKKGKQISSPQCKITNLILHKKTYVR